MSLSLALCGSIWAADRVDVYYTLDFESVPTVVNPDNWPAGMYDAHDGLDLAHIAKYDQPRDDWSPAGRGGSAAVDGNRTAAVHSLTHAAVIANGKSPSPQAGTKYLKGTIYVRRNDLSGYLVNYCGINGNGCGTESGKDKPRINLRTRKAIGAAFSRNSSHGAYRQTQYWCFDLGFPSNFHEEKSKRLTLMQIVSPAGTPENNIDLSIIGKSTGSFFRVERQFAPDNSTSGKATNASGKAIPVYETPVTPEMISKMVTHCFKANVDNRSGGSPSFKWMMSVQGASKLTTIAADTVQYGYSPTAGSRTPQPLDFTFNLPYGGTLNEGDGNGAYGGESLSLILDNVRTGGPRSSIANVHPLRFPEP